MEGPTVETVQRIRRGRKPSRGWDTWTRVARGGTPRRVRPEGFYHCRRCAQTARVVDTSAYRFRRRRGVVIRARALRSALYYTIVCTQGVRVRVVRPHGPDSMAFQFNFFRPTTISKTLVVLFASIVPGVKFLGNTPPPPKRLTTTFQNESTSSCVMRRRR